MTGPDLGVRIERSFDSALGTRDRAELHELLREAFGELFHERIFFKQIPHERLLLRTSLGIVGQVGVDYRVMRADHDIIYTLGVVDLCVRESLRRRGLGEHLMRELLAVAAERQVDHAVLIARDARLYRKLGFAPLTAEVTWLAIEELRSVVVLKETLVDEIYSRPVRARSPLRAQRLDLLGYMF